MRFAGLGSCLTPQQAGVPVASTLEGESLIRSVVGIEWCRKGWIAVALNAGLPPTYSPELFHRKTGAVFQHV